jgi:hypothetical protein
MIKRLPPLVLIAVACEAMAQDVQCVRERAVMVENIQAYARSDPGLLGPHCLRWRQRKKEVVRWADEVASVRFMNCKG